MIRNCLDYHRETSYDRSAMSGHSLDWGNQPKVFKEYPGVTSLRLPKDLQLPKVKLSAILGEPAGAGLSRALDVEALSLILLLSNTLTAKAHYPEGDFFFRSAASAGALYPTEIYVASHEVKGIGNGLYHFAVQNHSLDPLRKGDVVGGTQGEGSHLVFFFTAIFFRSAWKYRARAYRYHLLDTGHVAENLLLALKVSQIPYSMTYDFDDGTVNRLLGLDDQKEVALAIVDVPGGEGAWLERNEAIPPSSQAALQASRVSAKETDYPAITEMHEAGIRRKEIPPHPRIEYGAGSALSPKTGERVFLREEMIQELGLMPKTWTPLETPGPWPEITEYPDALFRRRSRRNFIKKALGREAVVALFRCLCRSEGSPYDQSVAVGFLAAETEEMAPGFYLLDMEKESWALVSPGNFMARSASICLDQSWLKNAGLHFLFLAGLERLERTWGPRGYRYAMLTAGRLGQRLYVASEAMGIGCCGIGALYDGEAMEMLGLNQGSRLLYVVAVGNVKRS